MPKSALILALMVLTSCGGFTFFADKNPGPERKIASVTVERLISEENNSFSFEIDEKLSSLHSYYLIAQKNLYLFDEALPKAQLVDLYSSTYYLNLLAIRTQVDEIEKELIEVYTNLQTKKTKTEIQKTVLMQEKIRAFAKKSRLGALAMENLAEQFELDVPHVSAKIGMADIEREYHELQVTKEFQIYEKNIEHLSHMMEMNLKSEAKSFKPSEAEAGNITGQEFPAKVWALTFSNGPGGQTREILQNLKEKKLKASFFQVANKTKDRVAESKLLRDAGMEIGSQSFSNKELTKVGFITLEKEITQAKEEMEKKLDINVKFFRLPYGSGVEVPTVRRMIAKNKLIHVFWNIDTIDWMAQSPDRIVERTKRLMKKTSRDAGIILFHDVHRRSLTASKEIMDHLNHNGRRTCTLETIVKDMNQGLKTVCSKNSF